MNQGEYFKKELKKKKLTQEDAAIKLEISLSTISRMFKESKLETFEIEKIKEKLNINIPTFQPAQSENVSGIDFKEAYYKLLEKHNLLLESLLSKQQDDKNNSGK